MEKFDFMILISEILEDLEQSEMTRRAQEMKDIINSILEMELMYRKSGIK